MAARLARNYFFLASAETAAKILNFFAFTYLGRTLGPERYGDLEFGLGAMLVFARLVQLGLGSYGAREIAKAPDQAQRWLDELLGAGVWMAVISAVPMAIFTLAVPKSLEVKLLLATYAGSLLLTPVLALWFFQGLGAMHWVAIASLVRHVTFAAAVYFWFEPDTAIYWAGAFEALSMLLGGVACFWVMAARGYRPPKIVFTPRTAFRHLAVCAPIGLSNLAQSALWVLPLVILGLQRSDATVGWFGAAHRATMAIHTFVWWYFFNLLPSIAATVGKPAEKLVELLRPSLTWTAWAGFGCALGFTLVGRELTALAYGAEFAEAGVYVAGLMWAIPIAAIGGHFRFVLIGYDRQRTLFMWTAWAAIASGAIAWTLGGVLGAHAATLGVVAGNVVVGALTYATVVRSIAAVPWWGPLAAPALAVFPAAVPALLLPDRPWTGGALSGLVYGVLFALHRREDLATEWRRLKARRASSSAARR